MKQTFTLALNLGTGSRYTEIADVLHMLARKFDGERYGITATLPSDGGALVSQKLDGEWRIKENA